MGSVHRLLAILTAAALVGCINPNPAQPLTLVKDGVGHELVLIPSGQFMMGGTEPAQKIAEAYPEARIEASQLADEYPRHRVRITRAFLMGRTEVTVGQFRRFVQETGYLTEAETDGTGAWGYNPGTRKSEGRQPQFNWRNTGFPQTDHHPVVNVSYHDAQAYLRWLSAKEGKTYRLPTEAEWEYANRAGSSNRYAHTDDPSHLPRIARGVDVTRHANFGHVQDLEIEPDDPTAFTAPVGSHSPNAWGLFDMHGNAWEWVSDWYDEGYYARSPSDDPQGPPTGEVKVRRGGAWNSFPIWLRSSFRNINTPGSRCLNLGFRVVREL